jgi:hypothetical protein
MRCRKSEIGVKNTSSQPASQLSSAVVPAGILRKKKQAIGVSTDGLHHKIRSIGLKYSTARQQGSTRLLRS